MVDIPANKDFRLSNAILAAGGFTSLAKDSKVMVVRIHDDGKVESNEYDMNRVFKKGTMEGDIILLPDDRVIVPKSFVHW